MSSFVCKRSYFHSSFLAVSLPSKFSEHKKENYSRKLVDWDKVVLFEILNVFYFIIHLTTDYIV